MGKADVGSFEPQANIGLNITVDNKEIYNFANTLKEIAKGKDLQRYWKDVESSVDNATKAIERFNKRKNSSGSSSAASELIKQINSLKAMTNNKDLSKLFPSVNLDELLNAAKKIAPEINKEFSVENFSNAFKTFNALKEKGIELNQVFSSLADYRKQLDKAFKLSLENSELKSIIGNNDIEKIKEYYKEIESYRVKSKELFSSFLTSNNIPEGAYLDGYFQNIVDGTLTAQEAINKFKIEYSSIFEGITNNDVGLEQIQMFSEKMSSLYTQVEAIHQKINDIISNGVTAKSVENLNSESQRSLFGNLIQDEENLKTITTIIQNLIAEQNNVKNNNFVNREQFELLESYFKNIDSYLSSIKSVLVDVGDGEELSPLLKTITKVEFAIDNLSSSVKNIGLNMNIDVGSDKEMEAKAQAKIANALQAYQRLFEHLKVTAPAGDIIAQKFFDFDISQYDSTRGKLEAYVKFIKDIRNEAKSYFGGQDVLYTDSDKKYWTQASSAAGQVTKVFNEIKAASNTNPLENLFGKTDLSPIISQLENIVVKLDEISVSATKFSETFSQGVNVTTSVEEVSRLTEKVKELEAELAKVKITPAALPAETNILSAPTFAVQQQDELQEGLKRTELQAEKTEQALKEAIISTASTGSMKDAFQSGSTPAIEQQNKLQEEINETTNNFNNAKNSSEKFSGKVENDFNEIISIIKTANQNMDDYVEKWKLLRQVGRVGDNAFSARFQKNNGQTEDWYFTKNDSGTYDVSNKLLTTDYKNFEKIIISAENKLRDLEAQREAIISKSPNASTDGIDKQIAYQRDYVNLLDQTAQYLRQNNETLLQGAQIEIARNKAAQEYYLNKGTKDDVKNASQLASEEQANITKINRAFENLSNSDVLKSTFSKQLAESSLVIEKLNADFKNGTISIDEYNTKTRQTLSNLAELKRLGNGQILGSVNSVTTIDAAKQQVLNYASQNGKKISKPINVSAPDSNGIRTITTEIITQENEIQKLTAKWSAATNTVSLSTKTMGTEVSATTKLIQGFANKWKQLAQYMTAMYLNPYMLIYRIRDMITTVSELDYELMDLRKTADMSTSELHDFYLESNNVAKEMGVTTKEILSQASAWSRFNKIDPLYSNVY